jgi:flagellar hook-associated protein 3 FlgL
MISGTRFRLDLEIGRQTRLAQEIARGQTEIATGKRILAPSDDPIGAARVAEFGRAQGNEETWARNVETAAALAARADTTLASVATRIDRAKELMLAAASATYSAENRAVIADELRGIAEELSALRTTLDPRGEPLFRTSGVLEIPVSAGIRVAAVAARASIFDSPLNLVATIQAAAAAAVEPDAATRSTAATASLASLDGAIDQIANARADQGVRAARLERIREALATSGLQLEEQKSGIEGTNVTETVARIQSKLLNLEAAQAIFSRVNSRSLFDLIR